MGTAGDLGVDLRFGGRAADRVAAGESPVRQGCAGGGSVTSAPTVSVITITLNDLDGLKRTVDSVRAQRYAGPVEHIVIDGGSGDDVVDYLSRCEPGFAYWQSEPDAGRYDAMNQGIAHASGDLLWFLHPRDCFSDADSLAHVVHTIADHGPV